MRGSDPRFQPANVLDGKRDTDWVSEDAAHTPALTLDLGRPTTFNVVRLREYLPLGQRIEAVALDAWRDGAWKEFAPATSIGNCRLIRGPKLTTTRVRLRVTRAPVCPAVAEVGLFLE